MSQRSAGLALLVLGGLLAVVGVAGALVSGDGGEPAAAPADTTTTSAPDTTTSTAAPTTTTRPPDTTTTTAPPTTTTTIDPTIRIEGFLADFATAIADADVDYLFATLHPEVIELFGADLCRSFIEDEILLLENYRINGEVTRSASSGAEARYEAPVAFTFQGAEFESTAMFAVDDGVRWFGECR